MFFSKTLDNLTDMEREQRERQRLRGARVRKFAAFALKILTP
jgi:hypothetical protein